MFYVVTILARTARVEDFNILVSVAAISDCFTGRDGDLQLNLRFSIEGICSGRPKFRRLQRNAYISSEARASFHALGESFNRPMAQASLDKRH